jgi:hypothetical protein
MILQLIPGTGLFISGEYWVDFLSRFFAYIISLFILVRFIYYTHNGQLKFLFTFFLTGLMIFFIASTLDQVSLNIGIALGLFAIFGIIRFRTPPVGIKEMTYLFLSIGMAVINALVEFNVANWFALIIVNSVVLIAAFAMEQYKPKSIVLKKTLVFTPLDFNEVNSEELLIEDVRNSTGIDVYKVEVTKINKIKNEITAWIYFQSSKNKKAILVKENEVCPTESDHSNFTNWESTYTNRF